MTEEFVRKQDAIDMIRKNHLCHCNKDGIHYNCYKRAMKDVAETPSIESRKGNWIEDRYGTVICSVCGKNRRDNRVAHINFCNSCGADMRGEEDE